MPDVAPQVPGVEARAGKFPGPSLIPALHAIQERVGWLPREELVALSREVHRPLYEIEGLISFYPHFRTTPPERVELRVCHDLSCWLRGAEDRIAEARQRYGREPDIELVECSCLGRCDTGPRVTVNQTPGTLAQADILIAAARDGGVPAVVSVPSDRRWPNDPYASAAEHYGVLRDVLSGALDGRPGHRGAGRQRAARHGRRRVPHRPEVGAGRGPGRHAEVRDLQRG